MTLESILASHGPMTAQEISRHLQKPIEDVYERLVHLESEGIAVLSYVKGCTKTGKAPYQWAIA